jgi:predicted homoserine dehydrogenase-like protein
VEEGIAADAALMDLDQGIGVLWDAMPDNAMLILCTGAGDTPRVRMMQERKWKRSRGLGTLGAVHGRGGG